MRLPGPDSDITSPLSTAADRADIRQHHLIGWVGWSNYEQKAAYSSNSPLKLQADDLPTLQADDRNRQLGRVPGISQERVQ